MFDVGFWELVVVGVVALIVIGPERLPGVARTVGLWLGRMRRFVASVKADIEREVQAVELKRIMEEQAKTSGIHEIIDETRAVAEDMNRSVTFDETATAPASKAAQPTAAPAALKQAQAESPKENHG